MMGRGEPVFSGFIDVSTSVQYTVVVDYQLSGYIWPVQFLGRDLTGHCIFLPHWTCAAFTGYTIMPVLFGMKLDPGTATLVYALLGIALIVLIGAIIYYWNYAKKIERFLVNDNRNNNMMRHDLIETFVVAIVIH